MRAGRQCAARGGMWQAVAELTIVFHHYCIFQRSSIEDGIVVVRHACDIRSLRAYRYSSQAGGEEYSGNIPAQRWRAHGRSQLCHREVYSQRPPPECIWHESHQGRCHGAVRIHHRRTVIRSYRQSTR